MADLQKLAKLKRLLVEATDFFEGVGSLWSDGVGGAESARAVLPGDGPFGRGEELYAQLSP